MPLPLQIRQILIGLHRYHFSELLIAAYEPRQCCNVTAGGGSSKEVNQPGFCCDRPVPQQVCARDQPTHAVSDKNKFFVLAYTDAIQVANHMVCQFID